MARRKGYPTDVTHEEWHFAAPYLVLIDEQAPQRQHDLREVFNALRWMARAGAPWRMLPGGFPPWEAVYQQTRRWLQAGFFEAIWKAGLAEYDELEGISWRWQSIDGAMFKAPLAQQSVGPNPTDRGKKWEQAPSAGGRAWRPVVAGGHRRQRARCDAD